MFVDIQKYERKARQVQWSAEPCWSSPRSLLAASNGFALLFALHIPLLCCCHACIRSVTICVCLAHRPTLQLERPPLRHKLGKMATAKQNHALVLYPDGQDYTTQALVKAFKKVLPEWDVDTSRDAEVLYDLQYADYDDIDWDAAENPETLVNSYMLRKVGRRTQDHAQVID